MADFFTADWHLNHASLLKGPRGQRFSSVEEMNQTIIDRCNAKAGPTDALYVLGDLAWGRPELVVPLLTQLRCRQIRLVYGNHTQTDRKLSPQFQWAKDYAEVVSGGHTLILFHYAMRVWNKSHYGSWALYGHSHGQLPDDPQARSMDVGVDCHDFYPLSIADIADHMARKAIGPYRPSGRLRLPHIPSV